MSLYTRASIAPLFALAALCCALASCRGSGAGADVPGINVPPLAVVSVDHAAGEAPLTVALSAEGSSDPDGAVASCSWDFGDGTSHATGVEVATHTYTEAGEYTVTLTVIDSDGAVSVAVTTVSVAPLSCPQFAAAVNAGSVASAAIIEASGIAASRRNPGVLWVNNDSGDSARLFAVGNDGRDLGTYTITGASATDWEDVAVGPGPDEGLSYIFIGDIGDNFSQRQYVSVYRVPEPEVDPQGGPHTEAAAGAARIELTYPGGAANSETLMVDPWNGDIYIVLKTDGGYSRVLRAAAPHATGTRTEMQEVAALTFGVGSLPGNKQTTGGDISPSGSHVCIRTYSNAFIWLRPYGRPLAEAFDGAPCAVPLHSEPAGEAICFSADGLSVFTVSEGGFPPLYRIDRAP